MNKLAKWGIALLGVPLALGAVGNMLSPDDGRTDARPTWTSTATATATSRAPAVVVETPTTEPDDAGATPVPAVENPSTAPVVNAAANLRGGPGTDYAVVGSMQAGEPVEIVARTESGDWYQLASGAWVAGFLVDNAPVVGVAAVIPPLPIAPVAEATPTSAPAFIQPTTAPAQAACSCSGDTYNCSSFSSHGAAQACFDYCISVGAGDIHRLDMDQDGNVCER